MAKPKRLTPARLRVLRAIDATKFITHNDHDRVNALIRHGLVRQLMRGGFVATPAGRALLAEIDAEKSK